MQRLLENLAATSELMGQPISPLALEYMAKDLKQFPVDTVIEALNKLRRESKGRLTLAAIVEKIEQLNPDGRPGADEAWAMIPMDEYTSAVMTQEMAEALHIAQPLMDAGDKIAARMSFKEAYGRIMDTNKRNGVKPTWFPSLGQDKEGRDTVLAEAVRLGRLSADHAIGLLPPEKIAPMLQSAGKETLALEYKLPSPEETLARIQGLKAVLQKVQK
jgi:hypothetical protein